MRYRKIRDAVIRLKKFPFEGHVPDELTSLNVTQYRQVIAGMNRIVYEIRHSPSIVCDTRKDMQSLLRGGCYGRLICAAAHHYVLVPAFAGMTADGRWSLFDFETSFNACRIESLSG